ncbi:hypothetical protein BpHYR1_053158 [Brachionus plicatilis]|uniref:Uncharacterized protein n=1 Tax=Brachionus plicatilis TaxID=10195 RepID=A0A3M7P6X3_BRAPC|nr:hypothetical protein BpHYR1_053158 [Brachionus plicatilis]
MLYPLLKRLWKKMYTKKDYCFNLNLRLYGIVNFKYKSNKNSSFFDELKLNIFKKNFTILQYIEKKSFQKKIVERFYVVLKEKKLTCLFISNY